MLLAKKTNVLGLPQCKNNKVFAALGKISDFKPSLVSELLINAGFIVGFMILIFFGNYPLPILFILILYLHGNCCPNCV